MSFAGRNPITGTVTKAEDEEEEVDAPDDLRRGTGFAQYVVGVECLVETSTEGGREWSEG